jgi:hypothetical protein
VLIRREVLPASMGPPGMPSKTMISQVLSFWAERRVLTNAGITLKETAENPASVPVRSHTSARRSLRCGMSPGARHPG